jgi:hypothetical protein
MIPFFWSWIQGGSLTKDVGNVAAWGIPMILSLVYLVRCDACVMGALCDESFRGAYKSFVEIIIREMAEFFSCLPKAFLTSFMRMPQPH